MHLGYTVAGILLASFAVNLWLILLPIKIVLYEHVIVLILHMLDAVQEKVENQNGGVEKRDKNVVPGESKSAKKKKEKLSKDAKEQDVSNKPETEKSAAEDKDKGEDLSGVDMKEKLKKLASMKKKKSSKEMDSAARAAASEAAARSARLAAAKKKEKSHYNQQPVR